MLISESDYITPILFRTRIIGQNADAYDGYKLVGFTIEYSGSGSKVVYQSPKAGERVYEGSTIKILLGD